ncbi:hypothetical protein P872_06020 [Rhodonellum psychrophilum GCM71 = DSM 17998]|uniref:Type I restriction modification DNA specificity domain-containing protein n=2 Tax=Rhodonellum TaxID=336827 RepID=U5C4A0_9BACT|nr:MULTISPECIES: restriction endonuclease subunit S [Rhodonellum]ERM83027.1 hypothetical protein P872_06020 [Rhodonellum psychrophilum GCM71 = DSM 17998]SDZ47656.1 type I restriction enzyme, S subunit [Rhodonellum ikkaensis]
MSISQSGLMEEKEKVPAGYKKSSVGIIPKEWEVVKLDQIGSFLKGKGVPKSEIIDNGLPCLTYGELYTKHHDIIQKFNSYINTQSSKNSRGLHYGDILFAGSGETLKEIGKSVAFVNDHEAYAGGDIIILRQVKNNPHFLGYFLNHQIVNRQKYRLGQGHSVVHIYASGLKDLKIPLPPLPQQQKIAEILSTWDRAIEHTQGIIDQLKVRNKGLAQQLLTGKKRLKGFEGEWNESTLDSIAQRVTRKNEELDDTVVTISAQRGLVLQEDFFKKRVASETLSNYYLIHKGEFAYNKSYSKGYPMGAFKRLDKFDKAVVTTLYICFKLRTNVNSDYMTYCFEAGLMIPGLMRIAQEGGRAHGLLNIGIQDFLNLKLNLPNLEEQEKITKVLGSAYQEQKSFEIKLATLKDQKKGLMQQLLTGKMRVKTDLQGDN